MIQANAKVERVSSKKLDEVLAHQKPFFDKSGLRYTGESSLAVNISKEMKFVKAKEPMVETSVVEKMKRAKQDYKSLLVRYKETKCEVETLNGELTEAYSKIKFLELEVIQANAKVERVSSKKLDEVLAHQKPFFDKSRLGYTGESSLSVKVSKDMKFVKAKEPMVEITTAEKLKVEKKQNVTDQRFLTKPPNQLVVKPKAQGKSLPKSQRGPRTQNFCHYCGIQGHSRPNCRKLWALKNGNYQRPSGQRKDKGNPK